MQSSSSIGDHLLFFLEYLKKLFAYEMVYFTILFAYQMVCLHFHSMFQCMFYVDIIIYHDFLLFIIENPEF